MQYNVPLPDFPSGDPPCSKSVLSPHAVSPLSTGEHQRLALARALLLNPPVLLLDEPTMWLDEDAARAVEDELQEHLRGGTSILMVTHSREQTRRMASNLLTVGEGRVWEGAP